MSRPAAAVGGGGALPPRTRAALVLAAVAVPVVLAPLAVRPLLGLGLAAAVGAAALASWSVAVPVALAGAPTIVIGVLGHNPFPEGAVAGLFFVWTAFAIGLAALRAPSLAGAAVRAVPVAATALLAALMLLRLGDSPAPQYGHDKLTLFVTGNLVVLLAGALIASRRSHLSLYLTLALAVAVASALVLVDDLLSGTASAEVGGRFTLSPEENPIQLGRQAATGALVAAWILLVGRRSLAVQLLAAVGLPLTTVALVASGSRGPVLGLALGLATLVVTVVAAGAQARRLALLGAAALAAAVVVPALVPSAQIERATAFLTGSGSGLSSNGRYELWDSAYRAFLEHPLGGIGTGGFASVDPVELWPHNLVLEVGAELGLPGLVLVAVVVGAAATAVLRARRSPAGGVRHEAGLVAALLVAALVNALFSGDIQTNAAVWLASGLAVGLGLRTTRAAPG